MTQVLPHQSFYYARDRSFNDLHAANVLYSCELGYISVPDTATC